MSARSEKALENKKNYDLQYKKKHFKRVPLDMPLEDYDELKAYCDNKGYAVNTFVKQAIKQAIQDKLLLD